MKKVRARLSYANVMSSLAVFLVLGGASAVAASQLGKNSVGSKQLQKNAVTAAKIKKNAVTGAKIKKGAVTKAKLANNAVTTAQIANGAVTGDKIDAGSTPFSRLVGTVGRSASQIWTGVYPIGTYTQPVGEADTFVGSADVHFPASCGPPRVAQAILSINAANPASPTPWEIAGIVSIEDKGSGDVTRRASVSPYPGGFASLSQTAPLGPTQHSFSLWLASSSCGSGSGVSIAAAKVDVIGTKAG